jgi:hypothetical protein
LVADLPESAASALRAALVLSIGSSLDGDLLFVAGLPLTIAAFAIACRAMWLAESQQRSDRWKASSCFWLSAIAALGIVSPSTHGQIWYEVARRGYSAFGVFCVGLFGSDDAAWQRRAVIALAVAACILHLVTPLGTPQPQIDVFAWTQAAVSALLHGVHPYTIFAPDVSGGSRDVGYTLSVYPYMPATLAAYTPWFALFGDFRYGLAVCLPLTIWLVRSAGRRLGLDERITGVVTLSLVLHPGGPTMVRSGWTEPLLVLAAAAFVYFRVRWPAGYGQAIAFFLLPALKQYVVVPVALYVGMRPRPAIRTLIVGISVAAMTVAPFIVWNWHATVDGMVFQMREPVEPRLTATSLVAFMASTTGRFPPAWTSVALQFIVGALAYARLRTTGLGGLLLGSALALFATFLGGWQAFVNYYYFVGVLLLLSAMALAADPRSAALVADPRSAALAANAESAA